MASEVGYFENVDDALVVEQNLPPGIYEIRLYTTTVSLDYVRQQLADRTDVNRIYQGKDYIGIQYIKGGGEGIAVFPFAILLPLAIVGVVGWGIFKIGDITEGLAKLLLIFFGGAIVLAVILKKPAEKYIEKKYA